MLNMNVCAIAGSLLLGAIGVADAADIPNNAAREVRGLCATLQCA